MVFWGEGVRGALFSRYIMHPLSLVYFFNLYLSLLPPPGRLPLCLFVRFCFLFPHPPCLPLCLFVFVSVVIFMYYWFWLSLLFCHCFRNMSCISVTTNKSVCITKSLVSFSQQCIIIIDFFFQLSRFNNALSAFDFVKYRL